MRKQTMLRWALGLTIAAFAVSLGFSRALRTTPARKYLIAHLNAGFGRPVDVGRFDFRLLDGGRLEAHAVTVAEDPQFGNEYFLRAESLTAGIRWSALLAGRFEFDSITLERPSLNLARNARGHWNIESWLPPAPLDTSHTVLAGSPGPPHAVPPARFHRIDVNDGRINFKQDDDKHPLALLEVGGRVEQDSGGRWALDLEARPMRAGVELQDIGTLRLRGSIAGTSERLQPADLNLTWRAISVADVLRLARGSDYGVRGNLDIDLSARVARDTSANPSSVAPRTALWTISGDARLTGVHGWRLPGRDGDPAMNLSAQGEWHPGEARAEIQKLLVEMQNSHLQATGDLDWGHGFQPQMHFDSSNANLGDILAWYRAFRPDVAEDLHAAGILRVDAAIAGWPPELQSAGITSDGGTITGASLPAELRIGPLNITFAHKGLDLQPTQVSLSASPSKAITEAGSAAIAPNTFTLRGTVQPSGNSIFRWPPNWALSIEGGTSRVQDWLVLSDALAQPLRSGWTATGAIAMKMRGSHGIDAAAKSNPVTSWLGSMDLQELTLTPLFLNQQVFLPRSHVDYAPLQRTIKLYDAEAFGAVWDGTIVRKRSDGQWTFDLSADHLDAAELDHWLGPRARPGLLARLTSLGISSTAAPDPSETIERLHARGHLHIGEVTIAPLMLTQFDAGADLSGRTISIRQARADFFGGKITATLDASLSADPAYTFQGRFDRIDLAALGQAVPFLSDRMAGTASAVIALTAHGIGRENLVPSLEGSGTLTAKNVQLSGLDLPNAAVNESHNFSLAGISSAQGQFHVGEGVIDLRHFGLENSQGRFIADGQVAFSHALDVRILPVFPVTGVALADVPPSTFFLRGSVEAPSVLLQDSVPPIATRSGIRVR
jgi:hypothetical protein